MTSYMTWLYTYAWSMGLAHCAGITSFGSLQITSQHFGFVYIDNYGQCTHTH